MGYASNRARAARTVRYDEEDRCARKQVRIRKVPPERASRSYCTCVHSVSVLIRDWLKLMLNVSIGGVSTFTDKIKS